MLNLLLFVRCLAVYFLPFRLEGTSDLSAWLAFTNCQPSSSWKNEDDFSLRPKMAEALPIYQLYKDQFIGTLVR